MKRILHVDDDPDIRAIVQFSLESLGGFEVLSCESGAIALKNVGDFKPDLCLLDLMMPDMDGEQVFAKLREQNETRNIPVIFLTAQALEETRARLFSAGALDVIHKPFDALKLPDMIRDAVNG